jgi:hypothetical protein
VQHSLENSVSGDTLSGIFSPNQSLMKENTLFALLMFLATFPVGSVKAQQLGVYELSPQTPSFLDAATEPEVESVTFTSELFFKTNREPQAVNPQSWVSIEGQPSAETRRFYAVSTLPFAIGSNGGEGLALGAGFNQILGFLYPSQLGLGLGIGIDNYSRRGETVYPIFADVRKFIPVSGKTDQFYVSASGGYSFAFPRKGLEIIDAKGGPMGQVCLGLRVPTEEGVDIYFDLGARYQKASFERRLFDGDIEVRELEFRRLIIRVGIGLWKN